MILASCRKDFVSNLSFSNHLQFREYPDSADSSRHTAIDLQNLQNRLANRRVCVLVHGYNTRLPGALKAFGEVERHLAASTPKYDQILGFIWPGGSLGISYPLARSRANKSAPLFAQFLREILPAAAVVDVQTHSLGARVGLGALREAKAPSIRHLLLAAPAVDSSILRPGRRFHDSLKNARRCFVFHSIHDDVLKKAYPLGDAADGIAPALGLKGPMGRAITLEKCPNVHVVDCRNHIHGHSDYRSTPAYYDFWHRLLSSGRLPRYSRLV